MKISSFVLLPALLLLAPSLAPASDEPIPVYRVEVIVLTHLDGQSDRYQVDQARDYTALTDPLLNERRNSWIEPDVEDDELQDDQLQDDELHDDEPRDHTGPVQVRYPLTYSNLENLGPEMQGAWRRLEDSTRHHPLSWRAWYQPLSREEPSKTMRIHDEHMLRTNWLEIEYLLGRPVDDNEGENALGLVDALVPRTHYRLDGSIRIRQRQFTHAEIDLVWHEPIESGIGPLAPEYLPPGGLHIHRINQSRTIRPQRLEYFDSGWLGVLIRIEPWENPVSKLLSRGHQAQEE